MNNAIIITLLLCSVSWADVEESWLLVPGKSVGPIQAKTSLVDLKRSVGIKNVNKTSCDIGHGEKGPCIIISSKQVEVARIFDDNEGRSVVFRKGDWHTSEGLGIGSTTTKLAEWNGKPFHLWRFDWGFHAEVKDWGGGKFSQWEKSLSVRLKPKRKLDAAKSSTETNKLKAVLLDAEDEDALFSSDIPTVKNLEMSVFEIVAILK